MCHCQRDSLIPRRLYRPTITTAYKAEAADATIVPSSTHAVVLFSLKSRTEDTFTNCCQTSLPVRSYSRGSQQLIENPTLLNGPITTPLFSDEELMISPHPVALERGLGVRVGPNSLGLHGLTGVEQARCAVHDSRQVIKHPSWHLIA